MDFLVDLIDANESVNYATAVYCFVGYIVLLWVVVSAWVARDSYKRYDENSTISAVWFVVVLILNFPALMFYLVMRPEDDVLRDRYFGGGVDVPIANFVGSNGEVLMGIQLKINSHELTEAARDMRLSIDWESSDPHKKMTNEAVVAEAREVKDKINSFQKVLSLFKPEDKPADQGTMSDRESAPSAPSNQSAPMPGPEAKTAPLAPAETKTEPHQEPMVELNSAEFAARKKKKKKRK